MKHFFEYNWQVRDEWFEILKNVSIEELHKKRVGGVGSIADTMYHNKSPIIVKYLFEKLQPLQMEVFLETYCKIPFKKFVATIRQMVLQ